MCLWGHIWHGTDSLLGYPSFLIMIWHTTTTHPYQAGDSLIINHPVLLLSEPLDIWVCTKHKKKIERQLPETFLQFTEVTDQKKNPFNIWSLITFTQARYNEIWSELRTSGIKHQHDTKSSSLCWDHNLMWVRWKVKWKPVTLLKMTMTNHKWNWHVWF